VKAYAIEWSDRAQEQVEEIRDYLGPGLSILFDEELRLATDRLSAYPEIAPRMWYRGRRHPRYRRLILLRTPYHLYYEVDHARQAVMILRVWHEKRRPPRL
jgi:plasmid stabilization system protein ParE